MSTPLKLVFPFFAAHQAKKIYIWRFAKFERAMAAAVKIKFGITVSSFIDPSPKKGPSDIKDGENVVVGSGLQENMPTISSAFLIDNIDFSDLILFNLQNFFEVFEFLRTSREKIKPGQFGLVKFTSKSSPKCIGVNTVLDKIWYIFNNKSKKLGRSMLDLFLFWYCSAPEDRDTQIAQLAQYSVSRIPGPNIATMLLATGDLARGWLFYEDAVQGIIRKKCTSLPHKFWHGESLTQRKLLLRRERGPGEEICYAGIFNDLAGIGGRVIVECDERLVELFSRSFPLVEFIPRLDPPHPRALDSNIDYQASFSAPNLILRSDIRQFPKHRGYLKPRPERVSFWHRETRHLARDRPRVGFSWSSIRGRGRDTFEVAIDNWDSILQLQGVCLIRLQYDECASDLAYARERFGCTIHDLPGIDLFGNLDDVAALIASLDAVISSHSTISHIAGAVGTPLFEIGCDNWFHFLGQNFDPFYPNARLFRYTHSESIHSAIERAAVQLNQWAICSG